MIINTYIPNNKTFIDTKPKLTESKGEIDKSSVTVGDFTMQLSILDRTSRKKTSKKTEDLKNTINQVDKHTFLEH